MRAISVISSISLCFVLLVTLSNQAVSQEAFPERMSQPSESNNVPASTREYFGPLNAIGTQQIPADPSIQTAELQTTSLQTDDESNPIRATQFVVPQSQGVTAVPVRTSGYRETPTRPVRTSHYPNGLGYDETSFIREREPFDPSQCNSEPNHCKSLCNCTDEWRGFCAPADLEWGCSCKTFPYPNFLKHTQRCGSRLKRSSRGQAESCGCGSCEEDRRFRLLPVRSRQRSRQIPTAQPSCGCSSCASELPQMHSMQAGLENAKWMLVELDEETLTQAVLREASGKSTLLLAERLTTETKR